MRFNRRHNVGQAIVAFLLSLSSLCNYKVVLHCTNRNAFAFGQFKNKGEKILSTSHSTFSIQKYDAIRKTV